jgi:hypothetical protein
LHKEVPAEPGAFLDAIAPFRDGLVVACECLLCWYWLADLVLIAVRKFTTLAARLVHRNGCAGSPKAGPAQPFRWTNLDHSWPPKW